MSDWCVEYRNTQDGREYQSSHIGTRELAIRYACELKRQGRDVKQLVGPNGEVVGLPEIEQRYRELLTTGKLI
jgi:hypothetical protein